MRNCLFTSLITFPNTFNPLVFMPSPGSCWTWLRPLTEKHCRGSWLQKLCWLHTDASAGSIGYLRGGQPWSSRAAVLHVLDVSLLQHTFFKWMGCYQALWKPCNDHSFKSGVAHPWAILTSRPRTINYLNRINVAQMIKTIFMRFGRWRGGTEWRHVCKIKR